MAPCLVCGATAVASVCPVFRIKQAPWLSFAPCSLSNVMSSTAQYRCLDYISFPLQASKTAVCVLPLHVVGACFGMFERGACLLRGSPFCLVCIESFRLRLKTLSMRYSSTAVRRLAFGARVNGSFCLLLTFWFSGAKKLQFWIFCGCFPIAWSIVGHAFFNWSRILT